ncbi:Hypothetical protein PACV_79 [Pacmanvirus A23]|uniref:Hypothetical protein n=1 Tax=Pacmanvirus A23 TaxID=1932881 RepID=UPI000A092EE8|nr:Hypothetical protein B9W72_gp079 [Pacmanvirus A23]SIP85796.1 Hypothetical protein PACV_79 [Pacmanvirus A23]
MATTTICRMDSSTAMDFEFERMCIAGNRDLHAAEHTSECPKCKDKICGHAKCRHWHSRKCFGSGPRILSSTVNRVARILFTDDM